MNLNDTEKLRMHDDQKKIRFTNGSNLPIDINSVTAIKIAIRTDNDNRLDITSANTGKIAYLESRSLKNAI